MNVYECVGLTMEDRPYTVFVARYGRGDWRCPCGCHELLDRETIEHAEYIYRSFPEEAPKIVAVPMCIGTALTA